MANRFLIRNDGKYRFLRTIVQAIISVLLVNGGAYVVEIVAHTPVPDWTKPILVPMIMAVLAAVMSALGTHEMPEKEDLPEDYWESGEDK